MIARSRALVVSFLAVAACTSAAPEAPGPLPSEEFPGAGGSGTCDADGDGVDGPACGGLDCDDARAAVSPDATEACGNDVDDDCDGVVDEDCGCTPGDLQACWEGDAGKRNVGACADGLRRCGGDRTWGTCTFAVLPTAEIAGCDGIDSDCDGVADPDPSCGECPAGAQEICGNGLDDDCDGTIDPPDLCTFSCDDVNPRDPALPAAAGCCLRQPPAVYEFECHEGDGLDACVDRACLDLDDSLDTRCSKLCDATGCRCGRRDGGGELVPVADCGFLTPCARMDCGDRQNQPCYSGPPSTLGVGVCRAGIHDCERTGEGRAWGECLGEVTPGAEVCGNDLDDDCDGSIDEEDGATGTRCRRGATCLEGAIERCDNGLDDDCDGFADEGCAASSARQSCWTGPIEARGVGTCEDGAQTADAGAYGPCSGEVLPAAEVCGDGLDTDCDGNGGPGAPEEPSCCAPAPETCNGLDDDCDGLADEGMLDRCGQCPGTGSCYGAAFDDVGDCDRPGRSCENVEPSPFDPSLIALTPAAGGSSGGGAGSPYLYGSRYTVSPFEYQVMQLDPVSREIGWLTSVGDGYIVEVLASGDGTVWATQSRNLLHFSAEGELLCVQTGLEFVGNTTPDPSGDVWMVWGSVGKYKLRRVSGTDVLPAQPDGQPWPDGNPRCDTIDLVPGDEAVDLEIGDSGSLLVDRQERLWIFDNEIRVLEDGVLTPVGGDPGAFYLAVVLAPDGHALSGWPLRIMDLDALRAGEPDAIRELGDYGFDLRSAQGLADGTVLGLLDPFDGTPYVVHYDPSADVELDRYEVPSREGGSFYASLVVDGTGAVWVSDLPVLNRLDLASGTWETITPEGGGNYRLTHRAAAQGGGGGSVRSQGAWKQIVDAGAYEVAWGELTWEARAGRGSSVVALVRFADDPAALADSTVVCGPLKSAPADLAECSGGRRYAQIELQLSGTGQPVAGHVALTWDLR